MEIRELNPDDLSIVSAEVSSQVLNLFDGLHNAAHLECVLKVCHIQNNFMTEIAPFCLLASCGRMRT